VPNVEYTLIKLNFGGANFHGNIGFQNFAEIYFVDQNFYKVLKRKKHELWLIF